MPTTQKTERRKADTFHADAIRCGAEIVPFPGQSRRPVKRSPTSGEARGEILLFLGVRYERLAS